MPVNWKRNKTWEATRQAIYTAYQSPGIRELKITHTKNSNSVTMELVIGDEKIIELMKQILRPNITACSTFVPPKVNPPGQGTSLGTIKFETTDKYEMIQFLKAVSHLHVIQTDVKKEMYKKINIRTQDDPNTYFEELKLCITSGQGFEAVYAKALDYPNSSLLWDLGQFCHENQKEDEELKLEGEALKYYLAIPDNSPYYEQANKQAYTIIQKRTAQLQMLLQTSLEPEIKEQLVSELDYYKSTELKLLLRFSLNDNFAKDGFGDRLDSAAFELSAGKGVPDIKGLTYSEDGFMLLLKYIADLRQKAHSLEKVNPSTQSKDVSVTQGGFYSVPKGTPPYTDEPDPTLGPD